MVSELFSDTQTLKAEVRRLRGRLDSILSGSTIIPQPGPGGALPIPTQGALITGDATPSWVRLNLTAPASAVVRNVLAADQGDLAPSWKAALDNTNPTTIAAGATASPGTSLIFAHRDHTHGAPATYPATAHNILSATHGDSTAAAAVRGDIITAQGASPTWTRLAASVPAASVRNVLGFDNGDTEPAWKTALDGTAPTTIAASDAAAAGTSLIFSHRDHRHGAPATYPATAHNILSATHGDSVAHAAVAGDILYANASPAWTRLPAATDGWVLTLASGLPTWAAGSAGGAHALLDGSQNNDTLAGPPVRGDLIVANATPLWAVFPIGANGSVLWTAGTDPSWTGSPLLSGYIRIGSTSAPSNTTAGDATVTRMMLGDDAAFGATFNQGVLVVNRTVVPANNTQRWVYVNAAFQPDGTNSSSRGGLEVSVTIAPSAADGGVQRGGVFTVAHDSGAFNLTGSAQIGLLMTARQAVGATTVTKMEGVLTSMVVSAGTVTTMLGVESIITGSGGAAITTLTHYAITVSSLPTAVTTHTGLNIPNLGTAAVTTAVGIDITTQSGATTNFDIRAGGNTVHGGYVRAGAVTAPTNTTAGDLTATRLFVPNAGVVNGSIISFQLPSTTPAATGYGMYFNRVYTPNGGNVATTEVLRIEAYSRPTAADTGTVTALHVFATHDNATAFNPGNMFGIIAEAKQQVASTTATTVVPFNAQATVSAGDVTTLEGNRVQFILTGGGTITTATLYNMLMSSFPTAITTLIGMSVPNLGNAAVTTAIGIDIAAQTGATTNIGIRSAGSVLINNFLRIGSVTAPANNASGDLTMAGKLAITPLAQASITAAGTTILQTASVVELTSNADYTLSSAPTIADGQAGQIIVLTNVGTHVLTFQDQGTLASSNLRLAANNIILSPRQSLVLWFSATVGDWVQMAPVAGVL